MIMVTIWHFRLQSGGDDDDDMMTNGVRKYHEKETPIISDMYVPPGHGSGESNGDFILFYLQSESWWLVTKMVNVLFCAIEHLQTNKPANPSCEKRENGRLNIQPYPYYLTVYITTASKHHIASHRIAHFFLHAYILQSNNDSQHG